MDKDSQIKNKKFGGVSVTTNFDFGKFILNSLNKNVSTSQMVEELKTKGITKTRKDINNKITLMRNNGINIPFLKELKMGKEKVESVENSSPKFKKIEENISLMPHGSFKVNKRINGKIYQKVCKTLEEARTYRDNLVHGIDSSTEQPTQDTETTILTQSKPKRTYNRKEPKISSVDMSDIFENNEKFVVIISKDKSVLLTLIEKMLG